MVRVGVIEPRTRVHRSTTYPGSAAACFCGARGSSGWKRKKTRPAGGRAELAWRGGSSTLLKKGPYQPKKECVDLMIYTVCLVGRKKPMAIRRSRSLRTLQPGKKLLRSRNHAAPRFRQLRTSAPPLPSGGAVSGAGDEDPELQRAPSLREGHAVLPAGPGVRSGHDHDRQRSDFRGKFGVPCLYIPRKGIQTKTEKKEKKC